MTLPIYMKNRPASSFDGTLQDLEANVVMAMRHRFAPHSGAIPKNVSFGSLNDVDMAELPDECPFERDVACGGDASKHPLTPREVACVVDAALEDYRTVSPEWTPNLPALPPQEARPAKKPRVSRSDKDDSAKPRCLTKPHDSTKARSSCTLPTADDPMDESFVARLYTAGEEGRINPSHTIVRRDVLDVRRTVSGRVFFQCGGCGHRPRSERAKQSTLAPQSVGSLYRAIVRFMMYHVPACGDIPAEIRELSPKTTKTVQARGTKGYWVESAKDIGLRDAADGRGIVFCAPCGKTD